jgi:hypothetical protein
VVFAPDFQDGPDVINWCVVNAFRATEVKDIAEVSRFLVRRFGLEATSALADPRFLEWKYLTSRSEWSGSRGYVLEREGNISAHAGICPYLLQLPNGECSRSLTILDWAADPSVPRAGVTLFSELMKLTGSVFIIGGTSATRHILPRLGFHQVGEVLTLARWIRPIREFRTRPVSGRSVLRLVHGLSRSMGGRSPVGPWEVRQVAQFDDLLRPVLDHAPVAATRCRRRVEDLNYLLQCPTGQMKGYVLLENSNPRGYFIIGRNAWESRLLDIFLNSNDLQDWRYAYAAATREAASDPETCRIRAVATTPLHREALLRSGYWQQYTEPVMIHDPKNLLAQALPVNFQLFDGDAGY